MLDSVAEINARFGVAARRRVELHRAVHRGVPAAPVGAERPLAYARSFYGILDLCSILPSYLAIFFPAGRFLLVFRVLRALRVFRILKLAQYVEEASVLSQALRASAQDHRLHDRGGHRRRRRGLADVHDRGREAGFTSIPMAIYWAIVTMTTVGYGDLSPQSPLGQVLASVLMILGYGVIAVPTGIVTLELERASRGRRTRVSRMRESSAGRGRELLQVLRHAALTRRQRGVRRINRSISSTSRGVVLIRSTPRDVTRCRPRCARRCRDSGRRRRGHVRRRAVARVSAEDPAGFCSRTPPARS